MSFWSDIKTLIRAKAKIAAMQGTEAVGKYGGHTISRFRSIEYLPAKRYLAFLASSNEAELGISKLDLEAFVKGMQDSYKASDHTKVGWYVETIKFYLETHAPERMLFKTGAVLLLIDDEKPNEIQDSYQDLKAKLFDTDEGFRAFFLQTLFRCLRDYGILPTGTNEEDFLRVDRSPTERIFSTLTGRRTYSDYLKE